MASIDSGIMQELRDLQSASSSNFLPELIDLFLQDLARHRKALRESLAAEDGEALKRTTHTLKGSAGNLGAMGLSSLAAQLHAAAHVGDWARAGSLGEEFEREARAVVDELKAERDRPRG